MNYMYCNIHPLPGEDFIDAATRSIPLRERVLSGLALKIIAVRMKPERYEDNEESKIKAEFDIVSQMTNEEYERLVNEENKTD